ncbi:MAG TPA: MFS transporter, partial [Telmatospirillum sp.]|nr:MFS transporter [Telmatospirillum sp.]
NMILYRVGARKWISRIMVTWGLATAAMIFVTSETQFYIARFMIGASEAGFAPGILYYFTVWFPRSYRGRITSMLFLASACSGLIGAPIAGLVLSYMDGLMGLGGWRWLFVLGGLPCVLLGITVFALLKDRIEDASFLTADEKALLGATIAKEHVHAAVGHSLFGAFKTPGFLMLGVLYFLIQMASYGLNFWVPDLIHSSGVRDSTVIGALTAVPYVFGAITMFVLGRLSDVTGKRTTYLCALLLAGALAFILSGIFDHNTVLLVGALALMGAGIVASIPMFYTLPAKILVGAGAASGIALINTMGQLGGIVSPVMVGRVRDLTGSTTPALYVIAGLCLLAAGIVAFGLPSTMRSKETDVAMEAEVG